MEETISLEDIKKILARTAEITQQNAKLIGDLGNKFGSFTEEVVLQAEKAGLYVARIHDELFDVLPMNGFLPKDFSQVDVKN